MNNELTLSVKERAGFIEGIRPRIYKKVKAKFHDYFKQDKLHQIRSGIENQPSELLKSVGN
jgi:hypothetical protein